MRRLAASLALGLLVALGPGPARAGNLAALVDSVVRVYGGPRAAAKMRACRVEAEVRALLRGAVGRVRREFLAPDRLRVEIAYPGATEVRILNGERGWRGDAGRLRRVSGLPLLAMRYQLLRSALPWVLVAHRELLEDRGSRRRGGQDYRLVGLPWSMDLDVTYWVNTVSRRVERGEAVLRAGPARTVFATEYRDFRRVKGVLVPFTEESYASGRHTGTTRILSVTFGASDMGPFDPTRMGP